MQIFFHGKRASDSPSPQQRRRLSLHMVALLLISSLVFTALSFVPLSSTSRARAASWNLAWSDEFNGSSGTGVSTSNWLYDTGTSYSGGAANWGTGEVETMSSSTSNVYQDGSGHLAVKPILSNGSWTSGRIETQRTDFAAPAGGEMAVEASIQMPNVTGSAAQGYWPAFWMLGAAARPVGATNWPSIGEIDAMENVNGTNVEYGTLHCGTDPNGPCNETNGLSGNKACTPTTCQAAFHTYRVEVDRTTSPEEIRWYLDGVQFWQVYSNNSGMDATTWANAVDHGFFIILNVAMGGSWPGNPTSATQSGVPMLVDYVRVYTSGGSTSTPTPTPTSTSSCTSGSFTEGVVSSSSTSALPWFQPCGWTAGYVILHYVLPNATQQNVYMTYNSSTSRWEYTVSGMSSGQALQYSFTYQKSGLQYDTSTYSWTHP